MSACTAPPWSPSGAAHAWPCGARVNINITGYNAKHLNWVRKAIANWNGKLYTAYGHIVPVQFYLSSGGPQQLYVHPVDNNAFPPDPKTGARPRASTGNWQYVSQALIWAETRIIEGMKNEETLTNTLAHEMGHTVGLDDCYKCGTIDTLHVIHSQTVMDSFEPAPPDSSGWDYTAWNFTEALPGPTACDLSVISSNMPSYQRCIAEDAPPPSIPSCTNGAVQGFRDTGLGSTYTCGGSDCTGCNSSCSNFASQPCPGTTGGSGGGGGTPPAPVCNHWCGNICLDFQQCQNGSYFQCQNGSTPYCTTSPIIIDPYNEGFHLTDLGGGVVFRVLPTENPSQISWTDSKYHNGWLALDRNGNGRIDDFTELL